MIDLPVLRIADPEDVVIEVEFSTAEFVVDDYWHRADLSNVHAFDLEPEWRDTNFWDDSKQNLDKSVYEVTAARGAFPSA